MHLLTNWIFAPSFSIPTYMEEVHEVVVKSVVAASVWTLHWVLLLELFFATAV